MKKCIAFITFLFAALIITGCSANGKDEKPDNPIGNLSPTEEDVNEVEIPMSDFFLSSGSKAHYKGEGNEFAELDIEITVINDNYTIVDENNGGTLIRKVYRIVEDRIDVISEDAIDFDEAIPTVEKLDAMEPLEIFLQKPFEEGTTFEDWKIVETGVDVETPYKNFEDAIVIQMTDQAFINRKYFVQGFGEIKRESIMNADEGEEFIVTSTLETVE